MKKKNRVNFVLLYCFIVFMATFMIMVFTARAIDAESEYYPGATVDFNIPKSPIVTKKNRLQELFDKFRSLRKDIEKEHEPIQNMVGSCPPESDMYQCPQESQVTDSVSIFNEGTEKGSK